MAFLLAWVRAVEQRELDFFSHRRWFTPGTASSLAHTTFSAWLPPWLARGVVFFTSPHGYPGIAGNAGNRGIPGTTGIEGIRLGIH